MHQPTIALAGNPNTGKSTVFNALTRSRQHVGNWPGKTVARKTGTWRYDGREFEVVDLPGTYSLSAYSLEEVIARQYLVDDPPDVVVIVVDAANLERNLYLVAQILEMHDRALLVLNMADAAASRGVTIDKVELARELGVPVVSTTASRGKGMAELEAAILSTVDASESSRVRNEDSDTQQVSTNAIAEPDEEVRPLRRDPSTGRTAAINIDYGPELEPEIAALCEMIGKHDELASQADVRWTAVKLLEADPEVTLRATGMPRTDAIVEQARIGAERLQESSGFDVDTLVADGRYQWINGVVRGAVDRPAMERTTRTDRIDAVVTHRYLGIPIFLLMMWLVFKLTTDVSAPYLDWVAGVVGGPITNWVQRLVEIVGLSGTWVESLLVDGVVAGVGGVLVFVPVLLSLYLALALLEDSGYMARAAFVMDRLMRSFGLHGKSFLPMLVGFGCTVPAIYATRTLRDERDRLLTGLLVPFMSCGARLPVYVLFAAVFFPKHGGTVVFSMYLVGVATALVLAVILKRSLFRSAQPAPFVMELPPYRVPTLRGVLTHVWSRTISFVRKAWTIILVMSVALWFLMAVPLGGSQSGEGTSNGASTELGDGETSSVDNSLFARAAVAISPVFAPLGFDSWQASGAIVTGLIAKEVVVSTLAQVYGIEHLDDGTSEQTSLMDDLTFIAKTFVQATIDTVKSIPLIVGVNVFEEEEDETPSELVAAIHADFSRSSGGYPALAGLAFMIFVLLYTPCMVAIAAARHEFGMRWMWTSAIGQLAIAWTMAFVVFQGGKLLLG